jgi:hypothetical protein
MKWWQRSHAGDNSQIIQAQTVSIGNTLTYSEVKDISETVARQEIATYAASAAEVLWQRVEEFGINYYNRQITVAPEKLSSLNDPFMQRAFRTAEIEFGASGNSDIGEALADLLVNISQTDTDSLQAVILNEALSVIPKLHAAHVNALVACLIVKNTIMNAITSLPDLYGFFERNLVPLAANMPPNSLAYRHLQFTQTGWLQPFADGLGEIFRDNYGGIFSEGFPRSDIPQEIAHFYPNLFVDHERYSDKVRIKAPNATVLDGYIGSNPTAATAPAVATRQTCCYPYRT